MYEINFKNLKIERLIYRIIIYIGLLILLILDSIVVINIIRKKSLDSYVVTRHIEIETYEDEDGDTMYTPIYYYNVDGQNYKCTSHASSSNKPEKRIGKVYYDSKNPSKCMTDYSMKANKILLILNIIPVGFFIPGILLTRKSNKKIKRIKKLNETGKLVKGLPYTLESTNVSVNGQTLPRIKVEYRLPTGELTTLTSNMIFDTKKADSNTVDLLIDENDTNNYFIDFEINRKNGNLPDDYYRG